MKKVLLTALLICFAYYTYNTLDNFIKAYSQKKVLRNENQQETQDKTNLITYNGRKYQYLIFSLKQNEKISFLINYAEKATQDIIKTEKCTKAINGGFYDTNNKPIGLLIVNNKIIQNSTNNNFLNGFLASYTNNIVKVENKEPTEGTVNAIQSGPLLVQQGDTLSLAITKDKQARRSVVLEDTNGKIYFVLIYKPDSIYSGPFLVELPLIVKEIARLEKIEVNNSLNLDGGSASFIKTKNRYISEYKNVMVVLCIKE